MVVGSTGEKMFNKEQLENLFIHKKIPVKKIAEMYGCSEFPVKRSLKKFNIKAQPFLQPCKDCGKLVLSTPKAKRNFCNQRCYHHFLFCYPFPDERKHAHFTKEEIELIKKNPEKLKELSMTLKKSQTAIRLKLWRLKTGYKFKKKEHGHKEERS